MLHYCLSVLDIPVAFVRASERGFEGRKSDLILDHCRKLEAELCVLGMHGRDYLREADFFAERISVYYQNYRHPVYSQRFGEFCANLSIVDLLFNCGPESKSILLTGNVSRSELIAEGLRLSEPSALEPLQAEAAVS